MGKQSEPQQHPVTREHLQEIKRAADYMSKAVGVDTVWARAFEALADAADRLDAMQARTEVPPPSVDNSWKV